MTEAPITAWSVPRSNLDQLFHLWTMPMQIGLDFLHTSTEMALAAFPRAEEAAQKAEATVKEVAREAEEQIAKIDEGGETIPTPAALVS
jgi:hypothetical protein